MSDNYSLAEVHALVETYMESRQAPTTIVQGLRRHEQPDGAPVTDPTRKPFPLRSTSVDLIVRHADLQRAMKRIPRVLREAVFWVGVVGLTTSQYAHKLDVSQPTAWRRYQNGLTAIHNTINGRHHSVSF